jgi:hypothetical protein
MLQDLYNRMIQGMTGQLPRGIDPLAARRLYGGSGDIGAEGRVAPATKGGLPGIVDVDLRTGKGVSSTFRRPDMETSNVPTYDRGAGQYIYDGAMRSTPLTSGLDKNGKVDRRQSDEYKATRARYDQLRKDDPEKALDYGLQEWAKMYPELAARQQQGSFNPLMQQTFGYQTGEGPGQLPAGMAPDQQTVMGDLGSRAQGEGGYDYEALMAERARRDMQSPDPLMQQEMQQQATAAQADKATTAGMSGSALDRTDQFLTEFGPFFTPKQSNVRFPDPSGRTPGINPNPFSTSILN